MGLFVARTSDDGSGRRPALVDVASPIAVAIEGESVAAAPGAAALAAVFKTTWVYYSKKSTLAWN